MGYTSLALWQVVSLQGQWCDYMEAAFINGSWSWPRTAQRRPECLVWRIHQGSAMTPMAEHVPPYSTCPPHCLWGGRQEICLSQGCNYGKAAIRWLVGLLLPKSVKGLKSQSFSKLPNTPLKGCPRSCCTLPAGGPLTSNSLGLQLASRKEATLDPVLWSP